MARRLGALFAGVLLALTTVFAAYAGHGSTYRVSEGPGGVDPDDDSSRVVIARDGNFIVYHSRANNLVAGDQHGAGTDVFATDITNPASPVTVFVSKDNNGTNNPDGDSTFPAVSNDVSGTRYVVFQSVATNLLVGQTTAGGNILRRNLTTGATELVSSKADGNDGPGNNTRPTVSCDGRYVAFNSTGKLVPEDTDTNTDVYLRDMSLAPGTAGWMTRISQTIAGGTNEDSIRAIIDCSGDHIVFASGAALIPADVNAQDDIYRWTRGVGVELASLKDDEGQFNKSSQRPWISPEGNWVVFQTAATNVPGDTNGNHDIYLRNMTAGTTTLVSLKADGTQPGGANTRGVVSDNGRYVAWAANSPLVNTDKNGRRDVYVRDMTLLPSTGIVRVSERTDHTEGACPATAAASTGGYTTAARAGTTNISTRPTISADGMRIGYTSSFCTLDPDDGTPVDDIYLTVRT